MFQLPSIEECKANKKLLINTWLNKKSSDTFQKKLTKARQFFEKCLVFHHFVLDFSQEHYLYKEQIPEVLTDGLLKSRSLLNKMTFKRVLELDILLGLDRYVYFSFGIPILQTGPSALIFAVPLKVLIDNYPYPKAWASWGDVLLFVEKMFGEEAIFHDLQPQQLEQLVDQYKQTIILLEDIPELAAYFALSNFNDHIHALTRKWKTENPWYYQGPEIKVEKVFPLTLITHCFINEFNSPSGKLAFILKEKGMLTKNCIITEDLYFF